MKNVRKTLIVAAITGTLVTVPTTGIAMRMPGRGPERRRPARGFDPDLPAPDARARAAVDAEPAELLAPRPRRPLPAPDAPPADAAAGPGVRGL